MASISLFFVVTLIAATQALAFPKELPDGLYTFAIDLNGRALSEPVLIQTVNASSLVHTRAGPPPLPVGQTTCTRGKFERSDFSSVRDLFKTSCDDAKQYDATSAVVLSKCLHKSLFPRHYIISSLQLTYPIFF